MVVPHLPVHVLALPSHMRKVENDTVPQLAFTPQLLLRELGRIHVVHDGLVLFFEICYALGGLGVFLQQLVVGVVGRGREVCAAVVLDHCARKGQVAVADDQDAIVDVKRDRGLRVLLLLLLVRLCWRRVLVHSAAFAFDLGLFSRLAGSGLLRLVLAFLVFGHVDGFGAYRCASFFFLYSSSSKSCFLCFEIDAAVLALASPDGGEHAEKGR